jgi:hypothetical protein
MAPADSTYAESLGELVTRYPRLARSLMQAEATRRGQLDALLDGARLRAARMSCFATSTQWQRHSKANPRCARSRR